MDDLQSYSMEKVTPKKLKSSEQLRRHSLDSTLEKKTIDRALFIFTSGDEVQKHSVIESIPELLSEDRVGCMQTIVPKMQQTLAGGRTEYHVAVSQTILAILRDRLIPTQQFVDTFLPSIISSMEHKDPMVAKVWCDTLIEAINVLPVDVLRLAVTPIAVARSQMGRPRDIRISSCNLLGQLSTKYDANSLKKELLPSILSLCQDVDGEVRATICYQLQKVINQLKQEYHKTTIFSSLIELASDEVLKVKQAAFETIVGVLETTVPEVTKSSLVPLLKQLINYGFNTDDTLLLTVSSIFGKLCLGIEKVAGAEKELFLKYYVAMASIGMVQRKPDRSLDPQMQINHSSLSAEQYVLCRQACASNLSAMSKFCDGNSTYLEILHLTLTDLTTDPYFMVRRAIAMNMGEVCHIFGKFNYLLKPDVIQLLLDETEEVIDAYVPNLSTIFESLLKTGVYRPDAPPKDSTITDVNRALLRCENLIAGWHNWRLYTTYLSHIEVLHKINSTDMLFNNYVSLLLKRIHGTKVVPVRLALMRTVLVFLRYLQKPSQRTEIRSRIINEFCLSNSFYNRIFYVRSCYLIFEIFSSVYFKEHFFFRTLQLIEDPVPNIRWAMLMMLPKLKQMVKQPADKKLASLVDNALAKLSEDKDKEIQRQLGHIRNTIDSNDPKFMQNDARKIEEEKKLSGQEGKGGLGDRVGQVVPAGSAPGGQNRKPGGPMTGSVSSGGGGGGGGSTPRSSVANTSSTSRLPRVQSAPPSPITDSPSVSMSTMSLEDKEFFVDAGVQIPHVAPRSLPQPKLAKKFPAYRTSRIAISTANNPPLLKKDQRHSVCVVDITVDSSNEPVNNNNNVNKVCDTVLAATPRPNRKPSHLPRPLSCVLPSKTYSSTDKLQAIRPSSSKKF